MKHLKKIVSLLLTAVMVLAMCIPVMADDTAATYTITIANAAEGHTYEAYQIFTGELSKNESGLQVLSNIDWGTGVTQAGKDALGSAKDKAAKLKTENDATQFAKEVAAYLSETKKESVSAEGAYKIEGLVAGYYLIKDKDNTLTNKDDFYTAYITKVVGNVTATLKGDKPTLDKQIKHNESNSWGVVGDNQIGDTVEFRTITSVPDTQGYDKYDYIIKDTMSVGLTSNVKDKENVKIKVNDRIDLGEKYYSVQNVNGNSFEVKVDILAAIADKKMQKNDKLYTYYSGILNADAKVYDEGKQDNVAYLVYSNNPNDTEDKGKTPEKKVYDWTFKMGVNKVDNNNKQLTNAKFVLSKENNVSLGDVNQSGMPSNTNKLIKLIDNGNGVYTVAPDEYTGSVTYVITAGNVVIKGLDDATDYFLYETKAPEGYNKLDKPVKFNITAQYNEDGSEVAKDFPTVSIDDKASNALSTNIINNEGSTLPSTGGIGTTIFYVVGVILMLGAGVLLVTKKRMSSNR